MKKLYVATMLLSQAFFSPVFAQESCVDKLDSYDRYDDTPKDTDINNVSSAYYALSYSWAPRHCSKNGIEKKPGEKDYLQCGSGRKFGYILHGLWPQGALDGKDGYPAYCEGDQNKIDRKILEKFLCMTPSVDLLQHEYEKHGTCMHDETLETPETYFGKSLELHSKFSLKSEEELKNNDASKKWIMDNNPFLAKDSFYFQGGEWIFCFDNSFNSISCPKGNGGVSDQAECEKVKGNISNSGKKYYFISSHHDYGNVVITPSKGERCFEDEQEALAAGWVKAPN